MKSAEIVPIFKKGDRTKESNYRPISLLSPFSKILERHIYNNIYKFITKHKILHNYQYGFREGSSTELALAHLTEELAVKVQNGETICSVFLDLTKAFDTVNHSILLSKLYRYGIRGVPAKLLTDYLSNRTQQTRVNGTKSKFENITCGVPQGSILGPLFFILYVNDLPNMCSLDVRLFADDACLLYSDRGNGSIEESVNYELEKVSTWLKANKLTVNYSKSNFMLFTNKKKFNNQQISIKMEVELLGA